MTYKCFLRDVISHLGANSTDETFHPEKHIAEITPLPVNFLQVT